MSGPPSNALLISFDIAGAALTGYGRRNANSLEYRGAEEAN